MRGLMQQREYRVVYVGETNGRDHQPYPRARMRGDPQQSERKRARTEHDR